MNNFVKFVIALVALVAAGVMFWAAINPDLSMTDPEGPRWALWVLGIIGVGMAITLIISMRRVLPKNR